MFSVDEIKKKLRGLRDTFGKELKKHINKKSGQAADAEPDSKWPYFKLLLFLRNTMSRRDLKSSVPDTDEISDGEDSASTCSDYLPPSASSGQSLKPSGELTPKKIFKSPKKKIKRRQPDEIDTRLLQIEEEKLKCFQESANDPDAQFLMSLLPFLKDIPKHRKLMVRAKLQQILIDEQNAISSAVLFDSSSDSTQYSVDFSMQQKNSSQGQMQQSLNILPQQQLSDGALTHYVMQFNPNTNN